jgi:hypothetical protein
VQADLALIRALGGGWTTRDMPALKDAKPLQASG